MSLCAPKGVYDKVASTQLGWTLTCVHSTYCNAKANLSLTVVPEQESDPAMGQIFMHSSYVWLVLPATSMMLRPSLSWSLNMTHLQALAVAFVLPQYHITQVLGPGKHLVDNVEDLKDLKDRTSGLVYLLRSCMNLEKLCFLFSPMDRCLRSMPLRCWTSTRHQYEASIQYTSIEGSLGMAMCIDGTDHST